MPPNRGVSVGLPSHDGCVFVGLLADARLAPRVDVTAEALDELVALTG